MKPYAIVGTGPSFSDIKDIDALLEARTVMALNRAINRVPGADMLFMVDPKIPDQCKIPDEVEVVLTTPLRQFCDLAPWDKRIGFLKDHPKLSVPPGGEMAMLAGCMPCACSYLYWCKGATEIELYGIDLDGEGYATHLRDIPKILDWGVSLINCCPTSRLNERREIKVNKGHSGQAWWLEPLPYREVPWTSPS